MHFTVEIARFAGYPSRHVHQIASAIIARAIRAFSAKGIEPQIALPEDEWFVETAKSSISKLLLGTEGSETSELDQDHINLHGHIVMESDDDDDDDDDDSLSTIESTESFASATLDHLTQPSPSSKRRTHHHHKQLRPRTLKGLNFSKGLLSQLEILQKLSFS
ncbi:hypothetical protein ACLB2K_028402 [Fragaria x ananassa]